jgi:hypothetical protein
VHHPGRKKHGKGPKALTTVREMMRVPSWAGRGTKNRRESREFSLALWKSALTEAVLTAQKCLIHELGFFSGGGTS